ncbi:MAG: TolC family protein [Aureispira sp.]|nr:TolC family protein [Aureispira sp.]
MRYFWIILILFSAFAAQAQDLITLPQAIEEALNASYQVKIANKNTTIAQNNNNYGEAGRFPSITLSVNPQNTYSNINNPTSFLNGAQILGTGGTATLDLAWTLFDGFKVRINKSRFDLLEKQSEGNAKLIIENIVQQVTLAYHNAIVQKSRLAMQAEVLQFSRDKISYTETRKEYGQATTFDILQVQDAYLNDSIVWQSQQLAYEMALQNLLLAMGKTSGLDDIAVPADTLNYQLVDYDFETLKNELLDNNQQIKNEKVKELIAKNNIEFQKSNLYPRLAMNAGISDQLNISQVSGKTPQISDAWQAGTTFNGYINFGLSYNIYNGGKVRRSIKNAKVQQEIAELSTKDLERQLLNQLAVLVEQYNRQKQILDLSLQLVNNAQKNRTIASERFLGNTLNFFDFRTIQTNYIRSINAAQNAFLSAKNTEINMLVLLGKLIQ